MIKSTKKKLRIIRQLDNKMKNTKSSQNVLNQDNKRPKNISIY